jgi:hypothetical protein
VAKLLLPDREDGAVPAKPTGTGTYQSAIHTDASDHSASVYGSALAEEHATKLKSSAISPDVANGRGYYTAERKARVIELGFSRTQAMVPALIIPLHSVHGEVASYMLRPDQPRMKAGRTMKYEHPAGGRMMVDVPPAIRQHLGDPAVPLVVTEGPLKADAAVSAGSCCIAVAGVWNWRGTNEKGGKTALPDWEAVALNGRQVAIAFDSDARMNPQVHKAMVRLGAFLESRGAHVGYCYLTAGPGGEKVGLDDWFAQGHAAGELWQLCRPEIGGVPDEDDRVADDLGGGSSQDSDATILVRLARAECELFHDDDNAYADVDIDGHRETYRLRTMAFKSWLRYLFHVQEGRSPGSEAVGSAIGTLEGYALFEGPQRTTFVRLASDGDATYLDLGDEHWTCVRIDPHGWQVMSDPPVRFVRPRGLEPLPMPVGGGSLDELRPFLNLDDDAWQLVKAWLVNLLRPVHPHVILTLVGEQGSAKSFGCRVLRRVVDPNKADLRSRPRDERDLAIAARNGWVVGFDNFSNISAELSDSLCRLATGQGFGTRQLYTDQEEALFSAVRPIVVNGISEISARPDLLDRSIIVELYAIPDSHRRLEAALWQDYNRTRPLMLGALLDAAVVAMRRLDQVQVDFPRMADATRWALAAAPAIGVDEDQLLTAIRSNRDSVADAAVDSSPVGRYLLELVEGQWEGTSTELLAELNRRRGDGRPPKGWPESARAMGRALLRLAPDLRRKGIDVGEAPGSRRAGRRHRLTSERTSPTSPRSAKRPDQGERGDDVRDNQAGTSPRTSPEDPSSEGPGDVPGVGDVLVQPPAECDAVPTRERVEGSW